MIGVMSIFRRILWPLLFSVPLAAFGEPQILSVDFSTPAGEIRALNGVNKGPLSANGLIDVTEAQKALRIPTNRLHDCHHPNPDVVDVHAIFPNPEADPAKPESYDFRATDEYLAGVRATGAAIIYRLGESIEHQTVKRHVHPPRDPAKWAEVCAGIVRHYNAGWAAGHHHGIQYWEIWNEPENRPVMWTGDDAQFLELYKSTSRRLRAEFPDLKIGGPGFGYYGKFDGTTLVPSELFTALLDLCRRDSLPLDFLSWHCYTDNPAELAARAKAVRTLLDARGFTKTESHLNEWNYLPGNSWDVLSKTATAETRQRAVEQMAGPPGGTFLTAALVELQDAPLDMANFYHAETGIFGLLTEVGAPTRNYHAMLAFSRLLETPKRVKATGGLPGKLAVLAGTDAGKTRARVLIANLTGPEELRVKLDNLPFARRNVEVRIVDATRALEPVPAPVFQDAEFTLRLAPPAVAVVTVEP